MAATLELTQEVPGRNEPGCARPSAENVNPRDSLSSTGVCLAQTPSGGAEYLIYAPAGGSFTVNLSAMERSRTLAVEWLNPATGAVMTEKAIPGGSSARRFTRRSAETRFSPWWIRRDTQLGKALMLEMHRYYREGHGESVRSGRSGADIRESRQKQPFPSIPVRAYPFQMNSMHQ